MQICSSSFCIYVCRLSVRILFMVSLSLPGNFREMRSLCIFVQKFTDPPSAWECLFFESALPYGNCFAHLPSEVGESDALPLFVLPRWGSKNKSNVNSKNTFINTRFAYMLLHFPKKMLLEVNTKQQFNVITGHSLCGNAQEINVLTQLNVNKTLVNI